MFQKFVLSVTEKEIMNAIEFLVEKGYNLRSDSSKRMSIILGWAKGKQESQSSFF